ncbi:GNAT family N-acetyltransferase [Azospirillum sp.]|uniref:GNAT family N-acetyltransferase n=1 Tax=Azospirillum sp. TaxID=34012 RepID=UPI002D5004F3|nr:GNAT family N-acetyltransferase [Azospirillum sp.]HYD67399.1 GNAT family N-acetyltransferase [Azospirillum sp.]
MKLEIVAVTPEHEADWRRLYRGYMAFYKRPEDESVLDRLWGWLHDPTHEMEGLVAVLDGRVVGLAHVRRMPSPIRAADVGFLDDLFIDPDARGTRVGEAILERLRDVATERGWPFIRWITADDNYRARTLYDRVAKKTAWNLYEMSAGAV